LLAPQASELIALVLHRLGALVPVRFTGQQHPPRDDQKLPRKRYHGALVSELPALAVVKLAERSDIEACEDMGGFDQIRAQEWIAVLADLAVKVGLAGLVDGGIQPRVPCDLLGCMKTPGVSQRCPNGRGRDGAYPRSEERRVGKERTWRGSA